MHTTNYINAFIAVAEDCPAIQGEVPVKKKDEETVATLHFQLVKDNPYTYTSDDVIFLSHAKKKGIKKVDMKAARETFFSKGQPCLRCSPLGKRYGWGIHSDSKGRIALFSIESKEYKSFMRDKTLKQLKAMRNKK